MPNITVTIPDSFQYKGPDGIVYSLNLAPMDSTMRDRMAFTVMAHGWVQKCGDAFAAPKDTPMKDRTENARRVCDNANEGVWAERGGARLDPVLVELRTLVARHGLAKADAARKMSEADIATILGARFDAVKRHAEGIVALRDELPTLPEPSVA